MIVIMWSYSLLISTFNKARVIMLDFKGSEKGVFCEFVVEFHCFGDLATPLLKLCWRRLSGFSTADASSVINADHIRR